MRNQRSCFWTNRMGCCFNLLSMFSFVVNLVKVLILIVLLIYLCSITTVVVLGVLYTLTKSSKPLPDEIYRYGNCFIKLLTDCNSGMHYHLWCWGFTSNGWVYFTSWVLAISISDWREPFNFQRGWLLWATIGLVGALTAIALTGVAMSFLNSEPPQREVISQSTIP